MNTLLVIRSSLNPDGGLSGRLADRFVEAWREAHPDGQVVTRDLGRDPLPHLSGERFAAFVRPPELRTPEQRALVRESDALVDELRRAGTIVLALPLYNFDVPSTLKAYFDHIARVGVTFRYTENGPVGLLTGKKAYVLAARGGLYAGTEWDTQTPYVRNFLAFLGITDVEFVYAEGLALGDAPRENALAEAVERMAALLEIEPALA